MSAVSLFALVASAECPSGDYILEPLDANPQNTRKGTKTTFCIIDTTNINTQLLGAASSPVYSACATQVYGSKQRNVGGLGGYIRKLLPAARNVKFPDAATVTATVCVPKSPGKKPRLRNDPVWDLVFGNPTLPHVGSATLEDAFRVTQ